jgi:hypothetical protein
MKFTEMTEKYVRLMSASNVKLDSPSKHFKTEISLSSRKKIQIYYSYVYKENVCTIYSGDKSILLDKKNFSILKQNFKKISKNILNKK